MTGMPAARQSDKTLKGGPIIQGSRTVYIGTSGGVACSACPGGVAEGNPVNPMLGAKVQLGEVDVALPGPLPFVVSRDYSSYQTDTPAPVGLLGPGWWLPTEVSLIQTDELLTLNDSKGRSIRFDPLEAGQATYSRSENIWIVRGGQENLDTISEFAQSKLNIAWQGLHEDDRRNSGLYFGTNNPLGPWWIWGAPPAQGEAQAERLHLIGLCDRFGRTQRIYRNVQGYVTIVEDGCGRQYHLETRSIDSINDQGSQGWGTDSGTRLVAVHLVRDPCHPDATAVTLVRYEYGPRGELIGVHGRDGRLNRRFQYHSRWVGRMTAQAHAGRPAVSYVYDDLGKVVEQRRQGALSLRFDYEAEKTTVTDSLGRQRIYEFEGDAGLRRVVKIQHADGSTTQSKLDASGRLIAEIDQLGRETQYERDVVTGNLLSIVYPSGSRQGMSYNEHGQLVQSTAADGSSEWLEYDQFCRKVSVTDALGHTTRYIYSDSHGDLPERIEDPKGGIKHLAYTPSGLLTRYTDCSGQSTLFKRDRWGQVTEVINALGQSTIYRYSEAGVLSSRHFSDGTSEHLLRDEAWQVIEVRVEPGTDALPSTRDCSVHMKYTDWGQLTHRSYAGQDLRLIYDEAGRVVELVNENGESSCFEWNVMDRLVRSVGFDGRVQSYRYDQAGQLIWSSDGHIDEQENPGCITHYEWTLDGLLLARHYSALDDLVATSHLFQWSLAGELNQASVWHYHAEDDISWPQSQVLIERDRSGRVVEEIQRLYRQRTQGADAEGFREPEIEFEHCIRHRLDNLGNREASQLQGLGEIGYLAYGDGHIHGVTWQGQTVVDFERDALHRETQRSLNHAASHGTPLIRRLDWNQSGRIASMHWSGLTQRINVIDDGDSKVAEWTHSCELPHGVITAPSSEILNISALTSSEFLYDHLGQLVSIRTMDGVDRFSYDKAGRLTGTLTSNAGNQYWKYDPAGNRLPDEYGGGSPVSNGEIIGQMNAMDRTRLQQRLSTSKDLSFDSKFLARSEFNLLQSEYAKSIDDAQYEFQKIAGNRSKTTVVRNHVTAGARRITYRYDSRGNRVESIEHQDGRNSILKFDAGNQLTEVLIPGEPELGVRQSRQCYRYDAFGRRLSAIGLDDERIVTSDYFGWDGDRFVHVQRESEDPLHEFENTHVVYEGGGYVPLLQIRKTNGKKDGADEHVMGDLRSIGVDGKIISKYLHSMSMPSDGSKHTASSMDDSSLSHFLCDYIGSPSLMIDGEGCIEWGASLDAWGNTVAEFNPNAIYQPIGLPGQYKDLASGLLYNRYRYFDPSIGEYINQDPVGLLGGINAYTYARNDPINRIDPQGLQDYGAMFGLDSPSMSSYIAIEQGKYEAAQLPKPPDLRPDGKPWGYGCGDASTDKYVPDRPLGFDFLPACRGHDLCYGNKAGPSKKACDTKFYQDMNEVCAKESDIVNPETGGSDRTTCQGLSAIFHQGVDKKGGPAFENARK